MSLTTSAAMIRTRLVIASLTVTWLALASLSSATIHFAVLLRDHAKSDLVTLSDSILDIIFQNLMDNVVDGMVMVALVSALFSIFWFVLVIYPKWLQENCAARIYYGWIQIVASMIVLSLGGRIASRVHGFQTPFEFFDMSHIPYYKIMYYESVGQAAFGSLVAIMSRVAYGFTSREHGPSYKTVKEAVPTAYYGRAVTKRQRGLRIKTVAKYHEDYRRMRGVESKILERCDRDGHEKDYIAELLRLDIEIPNWN
ncbi:unnamed protein product [Penicillium nalgiovense]|uniref:Uncharacterized protein n=1 Tax=Penicillium nalgiovense TaxID=60175 RepID=A0A9W4HT64_PENNA|nr:unnamed protein product [Penicillium nalgiovense]CAG8123003.1 unnamed protein product [Penicillium nalgiovense]CAG8125999.1 unnamed protein product [Penicillium nalgiovense]CAG8130896.1 unnamed protein product [Penicillium nalgiovense]CAG8131233.1 unnamed protein product [Penicillium nalgiovense]